VSPEGTVGSVPLSELSQAKAEGFKELSLEQSIDASRAAIAKGGVGALVAAATGPLESATMGASDALLINHFGQDADLAREAIARSQQEHAGIHLAGAAGGMFLNPFVSGAGGLLARGVGGLVGKGAASAGIRALQSAATIGAQGAVEGAFYGAGQQLSEDILGNHDITAEKLLAGAGKGALFGGVGGAALGAGGTLVAAGAKAAAGKVLGKAEGLAGWASEQAELQAVKSTGAKLRDWQKFGETAEQATETARRLGRRLLDEGVVTPTAGKAEMGQKLAKLTDDLAGELGGMRGKLDKAATRIDMPAVVQRMKAEVLAPLEATPGMATEAGAVRGYLDDLASKLGERPSFDQVFQARRALDKKLKWDSLSAPGSTEQLRSVRGILEDEFTLAGEKAAQEMGESFAAKYKSTKSAYADLERLEEITTKEAARENANRAISLTDTISGGNAALAGMALSGNVAGAAMGLVGVAVNKGIREYGNQIAATVFDKMAGLKMLQKSVIDVDDVVSKGVQRIADGEKSGIFPVARPARDVEQVIGHVKAAANDPGFTAQAIQRVLGGAHHIAPNVAAQMAMTAGKAQAYLAANAPSGKTDGPTLQPFQQTPRYNKTELDQFAARLEGVENPVSILTDLSNGTISREKVDAVRTVYPQLFRQIQQKIAIQVAASPRPLGWEQQKALSVVLGVPTDATLTPAFVSRMQQTLTAQPANTNGQPAPANTNAVAMAPQPDGARRPVDRYTDHNSLTSAERIAR
jgi:hypothetical protein